MLSFYFIDEKAFSFLFSRLLAVFFINLVVPSARQRPPDDFLPACLHNVVRGSNEQHGLAKDADITPRKHDARL
ncbi:hypothetical protein [Dickeya lacustris]|uniref:Secreted protein n=1 Tax=Dickeya lacustris TaxID=2259638 RepID=A0ABY8G2N8_9GAMM|nr:hypothetical protein [Dickeya lacustris]WFN54213.1 hypothetical protein O1Q98_10910 [Dickeya lacustris]